MGTTRTTCPWVILGMWAICVSGSQRGTYRAAEGDGDGLVAEAHAEDGDGVLANQLERKPDVLGSVKRGEVRAYRWVVWSTWAGGEDDAVGVGQDIALERRPGVSAAGEERRTSRTCRS